MKKALEEGKKKGPKEGQQNAGGMTPGMSQQLAQLRPGPLVLRSLYY